MASLEICRLHIRALGCCESGRKWEARGKNGSWCFDRPVEVKFSVRASFDSVWKFGREDEKCGTKGGLPGADIWDGVRRKEVHGGNICQTYIVRREVTLPPSFTPPSSFTSRFHSLLEIAREHTNTHIHTFFSFMSFLATLFLSLSLRACEWCLCKYMFMCLNVHVCVSVCLYVC